MSEYPPILFGEELIWLIQIGAIVVFAGLGVLVFVAACMIWSGKPNPWRRILRICLQLIIIVDLPAIVFTYTLNLTLNIYYALVFGVVILIAAVIGVLMLGSKLDGLLSPKQEMS